ncbi:vascular-related unknown protein 1-like isoform X2 [Cornus florida]|uniref:vascular-related unknown protein 1-like isoform X2 n=1 Tax=Cornus florida TaxID=4283 RepID=UPI00289E6F7A|nr:vascular-related unknown protein 1-like isoform X2 [Cornus florida]
MENSMTSMNKALVSEAAVDSHEEEESSWTYYFQDFLGNNHNINEDNNTASFSSRSADQNPSLVSDAASNLLLSKKYFPNNDQVVGFSKSKKLSFNKRKAKGALFDAALEDTASSPLNSPKVCGLNQLEVNRKERGDTNISREKCSNSGKTDEERSEMGFGAGRDSDYTNLKKKGLRLVPVSMFDNYLV